MIINQGSLLGFAPIKDMIPQKVQAKPTSYGLTECGYDIRIKEQVHYKDGRVSCYNPMNHHPEFVPPFKKGNFILGSSIEEFQMPNFLMGRVLNKSTWARCGVDASLTTNIEPGWNGFLTIELVFNSQDEIIIPAGSGICQIIFEEILHPAEYTGKYQNQLDKPVEAILS